MHAKNADIETTASKHLEAAKRRIMSIHNTYAFFYYLNDCSADAMAKRMQVEADRYQTLNEKASMNEQAHIGLSSAIDGMTNGMNVVPVNTRFGTLA
jgi:hypothetical protein